MANNRGMLPDEIMKASLIEVWPESPLHTDPHFSGRSVASPKAAIGAEELRPEYYVGLVRRNGKGEWHFEVLKAMPSGESHIPAEVMERMIRMRERIMKEQRSQRGREQALQRMADGVDPFQKTEDGEDIEELSYAGRVQDSQDNRGQGD